MSIWSHFKILILKTMTTGRVIIILVMTEQLAFAVSVGVPSGEARYRGSVPIINNMNFRLNTHV